MSHEHEHELDKDGIRSDGVRYHEADAKRLHSYVDAAETLSRFSAPLLVHSGNPHQHLYMRGVSTEPATIFTRIRSMQPMLRRSTSR